MNFRGILFIILALATIGTAGKIMADSPHIKRINPPTILDATEFGFSQVVVPAPNTQLIFISGQFGGNIHGEVPGKTMEEQMEAAFKNLKAAIEAAGASPSDVVQIRSFIVNHTQAYLEPLSKNIHALFGTDLPASTLIPVPRLALDPMLFEIEATLAVPIKK